MNKTKGLKLKDSTCRILVLAVIICLLTQPAYAFLSKENIAECKMLSPSLKLSVNVFQDLFIDSRAAMQVSNALHQDVAFAEYQSLIRVYDSSLEVIKAQGVSAYFLKELFKRALAQLNKRKVWSDFPSFYSKNQFLFGFKSGQKELYTIDPNTNIISFPDSLLDNFSALLFTLRHVIQEYNNPGITQDKVITADSFFFSNCFDYERREILEWPDLFLYKNRELLVKIQQSIMENNFSLLNEILLKKTLTAQTNIELKKIFFLLSQSLKEVNVSKGRMMSFVILLWDISSANQEKTKKNFQNMISGLSSIPRWSKLVKEANPGVFITKLDQLLAESYFGMHQTNSKVKVLLLNTVIDTLFYFQMIESLSERYQGSKEFEFRMKHSAPVRGILGEISGLHKYTFVFKDTVMLLDEHPQIDSRNKIYVSKLKTGEDVGKECDAHTAGTILEFKYSAHHRDIYSQLFGFMKQVSVFSLLLAAHQKKTLSLKSRHNPKLNISDWELTNVKNVVYFAENDINGFSQDVYSFVMANKNSFDAKTGKSLQERTLWNVDGFNCRLNLKEFEKLVLDPNFIQAFLLETHALQGRSEYTRENYIQQLRKYAALVFADMEKIYSKTGFDIYISTSNPKISSQDKSVVSEITFADDNASSQKNSPHFSYNYLNINSIFLIEKAI